jgi:uncharacterized protein YceH (UPF0502 family)
MDARPAELRVLGALIEKQRTTPDHYPLTLNALRLACNQATNRDPVVDYDDATIRDAIERLGRRGWARFAGGPGSRAPKYRHLLGDALGLGERELSVLAVLMLRGPQTPGELKLRTERMIGFADLAELQQVLEGLAGRELVRQLERRPGQKEARFVQLLGETEDAVGPAAVTPAVAVAVPPGSDGGYAGEVTPRASPPFDDDPLVDRVATLEREVGELRAAFEALRAELGA